MYDFVTCESCQTPKTYFAIFWILLHFTSKLFHPQRWWQTRSYYMHLWLFFSMIDQIASISNTLNLGWDVWHLHLLLTKEIRWYFVLFTFLLACQIFATMQLHLGKTSWKQDNFIERRIGGTRPLIEVLPLTYLLLKNILCFSKKGHIFKNTSDIAIFTKGPPQRSKGPPPNIAPHKTIPLQATLKVNFTAKRQGPGNLWMIKLWTLWDNLIPSTRRSLVYDTIDLIFAKPYKLQNASRQ